MIIEPILKWVHCLVEKRYEVASFDDFLWIVDNHGAYEKKSPSSPDLPDFFTPDEWSFLRDLHSIVDDELNSRLTPAHKTVQIILPPDYECDSQERSVEMLTRISGKVYVKGTKITVSSTGDISFSSASKSLDSITDLVSS